jgi:hypothetical protein
LSGYQRSDAESSALRRSRWRRPRHPIHVGHFLVQPIRDEAGDVVLWPEILVEGSVFVGQRQPELAHRRRWFLTRRGFVKDFVEGGSERDLHLRRLGLCDLVEADRGSEEPGVALYRPIRSLNSSRVRGALQWGFFMLSS